MERIICAAIWIKSLPKGVHNPKNISEGYVIGGLRHCNCIETLSIIDPECGKRNDIEQGFITSFNRYVDREEGANIALKSGQINCNNRILFSEDLY